MNDEEFAELVMQVVEDPIQAESLIRTRQLSEEWSRELREVRDVVVRMRAVAAKVPALEDDPTAVMLGLVPEKSSVLDGIALRSWRKKLGLSVSDLASRLQKRGWDFSQGDVFRWEQGATDPVPPAVVATLARILNAPFEKLITTDNATESTSSGALVAQLRESRRFHALIERFARVRRLSVDVAAAWLERSVVATAHRGSTPDTEQTLDALGEFIDALERTSREDGD